MLWRDKYDDEPPVSTSVDGHTFTVDCRYILKDSRILGRGSFGTVCTAYDSIRKLDIAIKRIRPYGNDDWDARHTLREIRLLKLLGPHPNVRSCSILINYCLILCSSCCTILTDCIFI
jgi:serine/threonine protein kinase